MMLGSGIRPVGFLVAGLVLVAAATTPRAARADSIWTPLSSYQGTPRAIAPGRPGELHLATSVGLYDSFDRGAHWSFTNTNEPVTAFAVSQNVPRIVYAASSRVLATADGGASWHATPGPRVPGVPISAIAVDPRNPSSVYAATSSAFGFNCVTTPCSGQLFRSLTSAATWESISAGLPESPSRSISAIAVGPSSQRIYAAVSGRLYRSPDRGVTWDGLFGFPSGLTVNALLVEDTPRQTVYAATDSGLFRSDDTGSSWRLSAFGGESTRTIAVDTRQEGALFLGSSSGVYRSTRVEGVDTWSSLNDDLPDADVFSLAFDAGPPGTLYVRTKTAIYRRDLAEVSACVPDAETLCLGQGRFRVRVTWKIPTDSGTSNPAAPFPLTPDTGAFWFFSPNNLELAVKVVDGRIANGYFWVFVAGLTDVGYDVTVLDTVSRGIWEHHKSPGVLESFADVTAFQAPTEQGAEER